MYFILNCLLYYGMYRHKFIFLYMASMFILLYITLYLVIILWHRMPFTGSKYWGSRVIRHSRRTIWRWPSSSTALPWAPYRRIYDTRQCPTALTRSWMKPASVRVTCHWSTWRRRITRRRYTQLRNAVRCNLIMQR